MTFSKLTIYRALVGLSVAALTLVGVVVVLTRESKPTTGVPVEPDSKVVEPDPEVMYFEDLNAQGWVTFVDAEMGFSISHPPEWTVRNDGPAAGVLVQYSFTDPRFNNSGGYPLSVVLRNQTLDRVLQQRGSAHPPGGPYDYHVNVNGIPGRLIGGRVDSEGWYPIPGGWAFFLEAERWTAIITTVVSPPQTFRVATSFKLL